MVEMKRVRANDDDKKVALPGQSPQKRMRRTPLTILDLPYDIYVEIFARVTPVNVMSYPALFVCKQWCHYLRNDDEVARKANAIAFRKHIAANMCLSLIGWRYPECDKQLPTEMLITAAECGYVDLFEGLRENHVIPWSSDIWVATLKGGHVPMLKHLIDYCGLTLSNDYDPFITTLPTVSKEMWIEIWLHNALFQFRPHAILHLFARAGRIDILETLLQTGVEKTTGAWEGAAAGGQIPVLQWLIQRETRIFTGGVKNLYSTAIHGCGDVKTCDWLLKNGAFLPQGKSSNRLCWYRGFRRGDLKLIDWMLQHMPVPITYYPTFPFDANPSLELLKKSHFDERMPRIEGSGAVAYERVDWFAWLHGTIGVPVKESTIRAAIKKGSMPVLKCLCQHGATLTAELAKEAIKYGNMRLGGVHDHVEWFEWLHGTIGVPVEESTVRAVIKGGMTPMLKCLCQHGATLTVALAKRAIKYGNLETLVYIHTQGMPMLDHTLMRLAVSHGHLDIAKWLYSKKCPLTATVFEGAMNVYGDIPDAKWAATIRWLYDHGCSTNSINILTRWSFTFSPHELTHQLLDMGCPWDYFVITKAVKANVPIHLMRRLDPAHPHVIIIARDPTQGACVYRSLPSACNRANRQEKEDYLQQHPPWLVHHLQLALEQKHTTLSVWLLGHVDVTQHPELWIDVIQSTHVGLLEHLFHNGCPFPSNAMDVAIKCDNTFAVDYLCNHQCPVSKGTMTKAVKNTNAHAHVRILHEFGCVWSVDCLHMAIREKKGPTFHYMRCHNCPYSIDMYESMMKPNLTWCHGDDAQWIWGRCPWPPHALKRECPEAYSLFVSSGCIDEEVERVWSDGNTDAIEDPEKKRCYQQMLDTYAQNDGKCRVCVKE